MNQFCDMVQVGALATLSTASAVGSVVLVVLPFGGT